MYYTYAHIRNDTGKIFYIGKGKKYRATAKNRSKHWQNIANKCGYTAEILAYWTTEKESLDHEELLISCFKDMGYKLANKADGGVANSGWKHSEEYKMAMSIKRQNLSNDVRDKLSEAAKGEKNSFYGKKHSDETKKKMSIAAKNRKHSWINKKHSEESKAKMTASQKARWEKIRRTS